MQFLTENFRLKNHNLTCDDFSDVLKPVMYLFDILQNFSSFQHFSFLFGFKQGDEEYYWFCDFFFCQEVCLHFHQLSVFCKWVTEKILFISLFICPWVLNYFQNALDNWIDNTFYCSNSIFLKWKKTSVTEWAR